MVHALALLGDEVPNHDIAIEASRDQLGLLLADTHGAHGRLVKVEAEQLLVRMQPPDHNLAVLVASVYAPAEQGHQSDGHILVLLGEVGLDLAGLGRDERDVLAGSRDEQFF
jgi:hypothetical protein